MKNWMFLGLGMVIGAGIGVISVRSHYRKLAFDEINEARDVFRKMAASKEAALKNSEMKDQILNDISGKTGITGTDYTETDEKNGDFEGITGKTGTLDDIREVQNRYSGGEIGEDGAYKIQRSRFNIFSNPPNEDDWEDYDEENSDDPYELVVDRTGPNDGYSEPFEISEDEFASEKLFYDKVMVEYYDDGVAILEESDQILESLADLIGPDILNRIEDRYSGIGDEIYIRNDNRSTDYGIIFTGTKFVPKEDPD